MNCEPIREHGVIQPIIVMKSGTGYEIVAGEKMEGCVRKWTCRNSSGWAGTY